MNATLPETQAEAAERTRLAEKRLSQDGRCKTSVEGRDIDLRVSIVPTLHGESVVLRILDRAQAPLDLGKLGLPYGSSYTVTDQITGASWIWSEHNYVKLDAFNEPVHILRVEHN